MISVGDTDDMWWDAHRKEVRLPALVDDRYIIARIEAEAVRRYVGRRIHGQRVLSKARQHHHPLAQTYLRRLIHEGRFEDDGTVLLRAGDVRPRDA